MNDVAEDILMHYGVKRRSGRYPWGSGDNPYQHSGDFLSRVEEHRKNGLSEKDIVDAMELDSIKQLRVSCTVAKNERRRLDVDRAKSLSKDGLGATEIGKIMGVNESTVRSWLDPNSEARMNRAIATKDILIKELETKKMIDVGAQVHRELGVTHNVLDEAIFMMEAEGHAVRFGVGIPQPNNPSHRTTVMVLAKPDISQSYAYKHTDEIMPVGEYHSKDGGLRWDKREYPASIDSNRVHIQYGDQGGSQKDGVIEIRRGVADLDLGNSHYAQVRIMVDDTHYLKGMAMYSDDIPAGKDIVFNTNKLTGTPKEKVFKEIKSDPDNPFGAYIKADGQSKYIGADGKEHLSAINKIKEEGDWDTYSRNLSQQFLSKQPMKLIKQQLKLTYDDAESEFKDICALTNPVVKKKLLMEFANECDSKTVHLKAAALPRQETRVILPVTKLKETEVYAPYLENGEKVALVRYPHAGTFEIPTLTVNNKNPHAKKILGNATDAIGINAKVAEQLSGADFDGDTVVVIPMSSKARVNATRPYKELIDFDPKVEYSTEGKTGVKLMPKGSVGREMGIISNLINDMTLRGANDDEIIRAVRHSMVVIDAHKHKLDYKQSEKDHGIAQLKKNYQPKYDDDGNIVGGGGASTLLSRRKQDIEVPERRGSGRIDPETGKVTYKESGRTYINKKGEIVEAKIKVKLLNATEDLRDLSSGTPQENAYADYGNKMKALAAQARKEWANAPNLQYSSSAAKIYDAEVQSLKDKLDTAARDAPRQRRAQALANSIIKTKLQEYPELTEKENKKDRAKMERLALDDARRQVGAGSKDHQIVLTDREWEAIQAGAVSHTRATEIFRYCDPDAVRQRAMPKTTTQLSTAKVNKINWMKNQGYTIAEIAKANGVSVSTVNDYIKS